VEEDQRGGQKGRGRKKKEAKVNRGKIACRERGVGRGVRSG